MVSENQFIQICEENKHCLTSIGNDNFFFFETDKTLREFQRDFSTARGLKGKYLWFKFTSRHNFEKEQDNLNIDIGFIGIIGYSNLYSFPIEIPSSFDIIRKYLNSKDFHNILSKDVKNIHNCYKYKHPIVYLVTKNIAHWEMVNAMIKSEDLDPFMFFYLKKWEGYSFVINSGIPFDEEDFQEGKTTLFVCNEKEETFLFSADFNQESIKKFLEEVKNKKCPIHKETMKEIEDHVDPYDPAGDTLLEIVHSNFKKIVLETKVDVLVCATCYKMKKTHKNILSALAFSCYAMGEEIIFCKIKHEHNYLDKQFFPENDFKKGVYKFFKKDDKTQCLTFNGNHDDETGKELIKFILDNKTKTKSIKKDKIKKEKEISVSSDASVVQSDLIKEENLDLNLDHSTKLCNIFSDFYAKFSNYPNFFPIRRIINEEKDLFICFKQDIVGKKKVMSFLSEGLTKFGQKEILFIIEINEESRGMMNAQGGLNYSNEKTLLIIRFYNIIRICASKKIYPLTFDLCKFAQSNEMENPFGTLKGLIFHPSNNHELNRFPKKFKGRKDFLFAVFVTEEEMKFAKEFGGTRILVNLGIKYRVFPRISMSDLKRKKSLCSPISPLISIPRINHHNLRHLIAKLFTHEGKIHLFFIIPKKEGALIQDIVKSIEEHKFEFLSFSTMFDERAEVLLGFDDQQKKTIHAVHPLLKKPKSQSGNWFGFGKVLPNIPEEILLIEDGFLIQINDVNFQKIIDGLKEGKHVRVNIDDKKICEIVYIDIEEVKRKFSEAHTPKFEQTEQIKCLSSTVSSLNLLIQRNVAKEDIIKLQEQLTKEMKDIVSRNYISHTNKATENDVFLLGIHYIVKKNSQTFDVLVEKIPPQSKKDGESQKEDKKEIKELLKNIQVEFAKQKLHSFQKDGPQLVVSFIFSVKK